MGAVPTIAALHAAGRLSTRARNALRWAGCATLADVARLTAEDLERLPNVGPQTAREIAAALEAEELCPAPDLRDDDDEADDPPRVPWLLMLATWPPSSLRTVVRAIQAGAHYPGATPQTLASFIDLAEHVIHHERGKA